MQYRIKNIMNRVKNENKLNNNVLFKIIEEELHDIIQITQLIKEESKCIFWKECNLIKCFRYNISFKNYTFFITTNKDYGDIINDLSNIIKTYYN